jgi:hypothetical protein
MLLRIVLYNSHGDSTSHGQDISKTANAFHFTFALGLPVVNMVRKRSILAAETVSGFIFLACLLVGQENAETTQEDIPV